MHAVPAPSLLPRRFLAPLLLGLTADGAAAQLALPPSPPRTAAARAERDLALGIPGRVSPGHRLYSPFGGTQTRLVDSTGRVVHQWSSTFPVGVSVYMKEDGNLLRTIVTSSGPPGAGGGVQELALDGSVLWDFRYDTGGNLSHHDIEPLPNGNVLMIAWETLTPAEAAAAGRDPALTGASFLPDHVIEVRPTGPTSGEIVWEWHVLDHLIQDHDASKANFGVVADHPERIDVNYPAVTATEHTHFNSIEYDAERDLVLLSAHSQDEIWFIDHSTTTAEAAGHTGGNHGKGGDLLYRWGNPEAYRAGTPADRRLFGQHSAKVVSPGYPGAGNVTVFSNQSAPSSTVMELVLPLDAEGAFVLGPGGTYGPAAPVWTYADPGLQSAIMSSAERLPNGNTLICSALQRRVLEIDAAGAILLEFTAFGGTMGPFHSTYVARTLWDDEDELSAAVGGTVTLDVIAGTRHAGEAWFLHASAAPPGPRLRPVDASVVQTGGVLDADGRAAIVLTFAPGELAGLAGGRLEAVVFAFSPATGRVTLATNREGFLVVN